MINRWEFVILGLVGVVAAEVSQLLPEASQIHRPLALQYSYKPARDLVPQSSDYTMIRAEIILAQYDSSQLLSRFQLKLFPPNDLFAEPRPRGRYTLKRQINFVHEKQKLSELIPLGKCFTL